MNAPVKIAEGEIAREGRRVLRKLAISGAALIAGDGNLYAVMLPNKPRAIFRVPAPLVDAFHHRGWLVATKIDFHLPPCGEVASADARAGGGRSQMQPPTRRNFADAHSAGLPTEGEAKTRYVLSDAGLGWLRRALAEADAFAAQHQLRVKRTITDEQGLEQQVIFNEAESPLGRLRRRRVPSGKPLIGQSQFEAGERLRRDFTLAQLTPRLAVDFSAPVIGGKRGAKAEVLLPETVLAAKQRVSRALKHVGPGLADLLIDVCCHLTGLETAERAMGWPRRSGKIVLAIALDRLAEHYGMGPITGARSRRVRAWHAPEENDA